MFQEETLVSLKYMYIHSLSLSHGEIQSRRTIVMDLVLTDGRMDGQTDGRTDGRMDGGTDGRTDG